MNVPQAGERTPRRSAARTLWTLPFTLWLTGSIALMLLMGALAWQSLAILGSRVDWVAHTQRVQFDVGQIQQRLTDLDTAVQGYVISHDPQLLQPWQRARPDLDAALEQLALLIADNATQRALTMHLRELARAQIRQSEQVIALVDSKAYLQARQIIGSSEGRRFMDETRAVCAQMQAEEARLLKARAAAESRAREVAALVYLMMGGLAIGLLVLLAVVSVRNGARLWRVEEELATTLRSVGDGVIATDASGHVRFMNAIAAQLTGWTERSARGLALEEVFRIINEHSRAKVDNPIAKVCREGKFVGLANHTLLIARDGTERAIEDSGAPIWGADGRIAGAVLVFRDATAQRAVQRSLEESEQRFRAAVDAVQGVLWTTTAAGEMRAEQPAWAALTGQPFDEYQGLGWTNAVHPEDRQPTVDAWLASVSAQHLFLFEHRLRRHDGEWRRFSIRAIPLFRDGVLREWVGVHTDITEQRRREEQLRSSEARFRAVQDTSIDGFMVFKSVRAAGGDITDFSWIHVNEAAARIIGRPRAWFAGRRLLQELPGHRPEGLFDAYVGVAETGEAWTQELKYDHDGLDVYLRLVAAKSEDGLSVSFADLTERRRIEEQTHERERRFVGLANTIPQLAWTNQPDGTNEYFNRGWYAYTGLTEAESKRADMWERVLHPEDVGRTLRVWNHSLSSGEPYEVEFRLRRYDGAYRWFLGRANSDRDKNGRIIEWFGTCTDIDNTKRNEQSLQMTEAALREVDMRKDIFLATLSHELRNPLAPIRTAARLLESPALSAEDLKRSASIISRQVRHMASLLDDLLDVTRITRGAFSLKKEYVHLQARLAEAVESARPLIDAKHHALILEWPTEPVEVEADPVRLVQVASNLLTKAAKYSDPNGRITFGARIEPGFVVLSVRDTGVGLAPSMLGRVFDMFTQVVPNQQRSEGGLGIGLALVKGLVELHGGYIKVHSEGLGRGSEFIVYWPYAGDKGLAVREDSTVPGEGAPARAARRILVADDNQDSAESLAMLLKSAGYQVYTAFSGSAALELLALHRPNVAILDIGMPGLTGYQLARRVRLEAWGARMMLVAVTGWGQQGDKVAAQAAGFDHHLTKPVDFGDLERLLTARPGS